MSTSEAFERRVGKFAGGNRFRSLVSNELTQLAAEFFDTVLYRFIRPVRSDIPAKEYSHNHDFWRDVLKGQHFQSTRVRLRDFHLSEWIPSNPGRYFSADNGVEYVDQYVSQGAIYSDAITYDVYNDTDGILLPHQKEGAVMLYGVGSIRLGSKIIDDQRLYFLGASSSGISHQGIPIALLEDDYRSVISNIKSAGGVLANVTGTLQLLPMSMSPIKFPHKVPRYCLFVDDIAASKESSPGDLHTTVACMYSGTKEPDKSWTFCSFDPSKEEHIHEAVDWLKGYAIRFSESPEPSIFGDFDEYYDHFGDAAEFSITDLFEGNIDVGLLRKYGDKYGLNINIGNVVMGDLFSNISNSTVVNRSTVIDSFNHSCEMVGQDAAMSLLRAAEEIANAENNEAAELFATFRNTLLENPDRSALKCLWEEIEKLVPVLSRIPEISGPINQLIAAERC